MCGVKEGDAPEEGVLFRGGGGGGEWEKSKEVVPFVLPSSGPT